MIRAAAGGSPLFRLEEARRSAELRSLRGRRVAVLHGAPEIFRGLLEGFLGALTFEDFGL